MNDYDVDWTVFDQYPESTCYCNCDAIFRSHAKIVMSIRRSVSRKPCPDCGKNDNLRRVSSDPETYIIGG